MTDGRDRGSAAAWRKKYLKKLQQLETVEARHSAEVDQLRRALVSVSLVVDGVDDNLRSSLALMRQIFRGDQNGDQLSSLLKKVQNQARSVRERNTPQQSIYQLQRLTRQLEPLATNRKLKKELSKYSKSLDHELTSLLQTPLFIKELAQLQEQLLEQLEREGRLPAPPEPFWQRFFGGRDENGLPETDNEHRLDGDHEPRVEHDAHAEGDASVEEHPLALMPLIDVPSSSDQSAPAYSSVGLEVSRVIQNLIEQLSVPKSGLYQHLRLQQMLLRSQNWYELIPLLETTAALVLLCIRHGRTEFTSYLQEINEQLLGYIAGIDEARTGLGGSLDSGEALTRQLEDNISCLRTSMEGATSLSHLKHMVGEHLHTLMQEVDGYKQELVTSRESHERLEVLGEQVQLLEQQTQALKTDLLQEQRRALRDALTGLPNRLAYDEQIQREMARCRRYGQPLSLVVVDIDFFKRVNDNYGHLAGDKLLRIFARQLMKSLREADFIARYGGEEFVLLLPNTAIDEAVQVVEKVRQTIAETPFRYKDEQLLISASFGIADWDEALENHEQLFERADIALYHAKQRGRDRYCLFSDELAKEPRCCTDEVSES